MIKQNPNGDYPQIDNSGYIDSTAALIGKIRLGKNVFIGPGVVIRADEPNSSIVIRDNCNIQDRVIIHALGGTAVLVDTFTSLSHGSIVHGPCKIGKKCFIGFGSVVFKAILADEVFIGHLAVVESVNIPCKKLIVHGAVVNKKTQIKLLSAISKEHRDFSRKVVKANLYLTESYKSLRRS